MVYAVKQVIYRNFSPETFKNSAILQTFASLPEKKFHESGIRHGIFMGGGLYFGRGIFSDLILSPCKKKRFYFVMTCRYTPTPPPTFHRRTPGGQPSSSLPWRSLQYILTYIQDGGSISWVQSVWRATTTSSRYDNRHFNPCSQLPYFSFQNITCSILVFFLFAQVFLNSFAPIISKNVK